ncbi:helix-turn-helix domain-containing protein [Streptomyces xiamenensis]|uniref:MmyB family transcriptional regulator n=1 Tax=Streptomyces xiamenensis TaxID=408015 RepID=UPI0036EEB39E
MNAKEALQHLLRSKRAQINPVEMGWPKRTGRGRRSRGLSQAQVALALNVSERRYADLERGEIAAPSAELLDLVAKVLRMKEQERATLYVYALGHEPPTPMDPMAGTNVAPAWEQAVGRVSGHPCYINDVAWNLLAANDEFLRMFPQTPGKDLGLPDRNLMRWMLLREEAREHHLVDWETSWARPLAAQLRTAVAAHPGNQDLQQLDEAVNDDPVAGPIYRDLSMAYVHPDGDVRPMRYAGAATSEVTEHQADRCCERHAPSQLGDVSVCAAQPFGSPGVRFILLLFDPHRQRAQLES